MSQQSSSRSRSSSRSTSSETAPQKRERKRGLRNGLYIFNALLSSTDSTPLSEIVRKVSEEVFKSKNISTCIDERSISKTGDNTYECVMIVDRMGQHNELSRNRLSGFKDGVSWSLLEANDIENWKDYYKTVVCRGYCQVGTPLNPIAKIVDVFRKALECKSITQCRSMISARLDPLELSIYEEKILNAWCENYKKIRGKKKVSDLYPVKEDSGCIQAIMQWIKDVFTGPESRPKALFIVGETRSGKSMTISNFLMDKEWIEYQAFDVSAKNRYGEQKVFRILDDTTFGLHKVDVLKMYLNSVDSNVNVKYGETVIVPIPTIILLNQTSFFDILKDFSDRKWLAGNIVVYPKQDDETMTINLYSSGLKEMREILYDDTKPMLSSVKWEDTLLYRALNVTEDEFKTVFNNMNVGEDIWKQLRKYVINRNNH